MELQRTLRRQVSCAGIGLHSGRTVTLTLRPAPADSGIRFRRTDLGGAEVAALVDRVGNTRFATALAEGGSSVETVEHLLAALAGLGIDNALVDLDRAEVPIMDGSAAPFVYLVQEAGIRPLPVPKRFLRVVRPIECARGDRRIALYPGDGFRITYSIAYDHPLLRRQELTLAVDDASFAAEIAPARTFTFLAEVERLRRHGFALGGSLDNAIVVGETGILNRPLRFDDEFVRHKMLDAIGDFALLGMPIIGHLVAHRAGHALHTALASKVLADREAWEVVEPYSRSFTPAASFSM